MQTNKSNAKESREEGHLNANLRPRMLAVKTIECEGLYMSAHCDAALTMAFLQLLLASVLSVYGACLG